VETWWNMGENRRVLWKKTWDLYSWVRTGSWPHVVTEPWKSLESWLGRGIIPKWPYFGLVNY
jgi:hypothetical protein